MAIYEVTQGKICDGDKVYTKGDRYERKGELPKVLQSQLRIIQADPEPAVDGGLLLTAKLRSPGWFDVYDGDGKKLNDTALRRNQAVEMTSEDAVAEAEKEA